MAGMRFAIDAVFIDRRGRVRKIAAGLEPGWRLAGSLRGWRCLELSVGRAASLGLHPGGRLDFEAAG
jgi:uncharacterized membrane protein (UPF0127 family)